MHNVAIDRVHNLAAKGHRANEDYATGGSAKLVAQTNFVGACTALLYSIEILGVICQVAYVLALLRSCDSIRFLGCDSSTWT